jgi:hypothetical protein
MAASLWTAYCDGASRGNPGPASYGVVLCDPQGAVAAEIGERIGTNTNQVGEYSERRTLAVFTDEDRAKLCAEA